MVTTEITTELEVGQHYSWDANSDGLTFEIKSIVADPQISVGGVPFAPFVWVQWSDEPKQTTINIASMRAYLANGSISLIA